MSNFAKLTLAGGVIENNTAKDIGGGVYSESSSITLTNGIIRNNSAEKGGGMYTLNSHVGMNSSSIIENNTAAYGGEIYKMRYLFTMNDAASIQNNTVTYSGGEVYSDGAELTMLHSGFIKKQYCHRRRRSVPDWMEWVHNERYCYNQR